MKDLIISILNTDAVQTAIVAGILFLLGKLFIKVPKAELFYQEYKGAMIKAVKLAEAEIPDDTQNKGLRRLDQALLYTVKLIEIAEGKVLPPEAKAKLKSDLSAVHDEVLDARESK